MYTIHTATKVTDHPEPPPTSRDSVKLRRQNRQKPAHHQNDFDEHLNDFSWQSLTCRFLYNGKAAYDTANDKVDRYGLQTGMANDCGQSPKPVTATIGANDEMYCRSAFKWGILRTHKEPPWDADRIFTENVCGWRQSRCCRTQDHYV